MQWLINKYILILTDNYREQILELFQKFTGVRTDLFVILPFQTSRPGRRADLN